MENETNNTTSTEKHEDKTKSDRFKFAICYVPLIAFVLFFVEENKSVEFSNHIKNGIYMFFFAFFMWLILSIFALWWLVTLAYIIVSVYFWHKAYSWKEVKIDLFDKIENKIKSKM